MEKASVLITSVSSDHYGAMFLAEPVCKKLQIAPGIHQISCGGITRWVCVMFPMHDKREICAFSPDMLKSLALVEGIRLFLYKDGDQLRIGPVFGIFANVRPKNGEPAGYQVPVFEHLLSIAAEEHMYAYVFGPQEVKSGRIRGYTLHKINGRQNWKMRDVPYPDVVYDQIITRKFEKLPHVREFKKELIKQLGPAYFNPGFFNKVQVHEWLSSRDDTKGYLPPAIPHEDTNRTAQFVERHGQVYLKPANGSLGIGIIKLIRLANGQYFCQSKGKKGVQSQSVHKSALEALQKLERRLRKKPFLAQEGLELKTYKGRPFDIRVLVQKDHTGKWKRTKTFCRIAQAGDITSNLSTGGDALSLAKILQELYTKEETKRIQSKIRKLVNLVPAALEEASGLKLGEIGLDIGIDTKGWVWIIEVNSKPWKKPFTEQGSMELVLQSFRRPLRYGKFLAGITC